MLTLILLLAGFLIVVSPTALRLYDVYLDRRAINNHWPAAQDPSRREIACRKVHQAIVTEWLRVVTHCIAGFGVFIVFKPVIDYIGTSRVIWIRNVCFMAICCLLSLKSYLARQTQYDAIRRLKEIREREKH